MTCTATDISIIEVVVILVVMILLDAISIGLRGFLYALIATLFGFYFGATWFASHALVCISGQDTDPTFFILIIGIFTVVSVLIMLKYVKSY